MTSRRKSTEPADDPQLARAPGDDGALVEVLELAIDAFCALDGESRIRFVNAAAEAYLDLPRERLVGRRLFELLPESRGGAFEDACRRASEAGAASVLKGGSIRRPGRVVELRVAPAPGGGAGVWIVDVTEQRKIETALRDERDRTSEILESISDAFYAVDDQWRFTYVNRVAEAWWGRDREELIGQVYWEVFPQAIGTPAHQAHLQAAAHREVVRVEAISPLIGRWVDVSIFPTGAGLSVYFRDITERKHAEERQRLLVNELNHRVKNSLAVVQAIARQTLREGRDMLEAREALTARLVALASAHDVLSEEKLAGADLEEVVERAVLAQLDRPERVRVEGPHVAVPPHAVLSLSLALHELATNALKYGALSIAAGEVAVSWRLAEAHGGRTLALRWAERGGPPVSPPEHRGFGSRMLERALAAELGGAVRLDFAPDGVICEIVAELPAAPAQL